MLKNKKKLRRMERNTPGYAVKTAQSLVLAGALVLGGAGMASAAANPVLNVTGTWAAGSDTGNVTINTTVPAANVIITTSSAGPAAGFGTLTITSGAANTAALVAKHNLTFNGAVDITGAAGQRASLTVTNGSLFKGGATTINATGDLILGENSVVGTAGTAGTAGIAKLGSLSILAGGTLVVGGEGASNGAANHGGNGTLTVAGTMDTAAALKLGGKGAIGTDGAGSNGGVGELTVEGNFTSTLAAAQTVGGAGGDGAAAGIGGAGGAGTLTLKGTASSFAGALNIGGASGANSTSAGGIGGEGTLNLAGGTTTFNGAVQIGAAKGDAVANGAAGSLNINGGATALFNENVTIGAANSNASVLQIGGVGANTGAGTATLATGKSMIFTAGIVTDKLFIGGAGTAGAAAVPGVAGGAGTLNVLGTLTGTEGAIAIGGMGGNGSGTALGNGGAGGDGTLNLKTGSTTTFIAGQIIGGIGGNGAANATAGGDGGKGTLNIESDVTSVTFGSLVVGGTGGDNTTAGAGKGGAGTINISKAAQAFAGAVTLGGAVGTDAGLTGGQGGKGTIVVNNGATAAFADALNIGGQAANTGNGELTIMDGGIVTVATEAVLVGNVGNTTGTVDIAKTGKLVQSDAADTFLIGKGTVTAHNYKSSNAAAAGDFGLVSTDVSINGGADAVLKLVGDQSIALAQIHATAGTDGIAVVNGKLEIGGKLTLTGATANATNVHTIGNAGTLQAQSLVTGITGTSGVYQWAAGTLLLTGNGNKDAIVSDATKMELTTINSNVTFAATDATGGGKYAGTIGVTNGLMTFGKGDWAVQNAANTGTVDVATTATGAAKGLSLTGGGNLIVDRLWLTGNANAVIGDGLNASMLTVAGNTTTIGSESYKNPTDSSGTAGIEVKNLSTLSVKYNQVLNANALVTAADGSIKVNSGAMLYLDGSPTLNATQITALKGLLLGGTGLLNLGGANLGLAPADVVYSAVNGITSDSLLKESMKLTVANAGTGVSGGFASLTVTDAVTTPLNINVNSTLILAGGANGSTQLVNANVSGTGKITMAVAQDQVLTFGNQLTANDKTHGTLTGDVSLAAGTSATVRTTFNSVNGTFGVTGNLNVLGANALTNISNADLTVNALVNTGGNTTVVNASDGSFIVATGAAVVGNVLLDGGTVATLDKATTTNTTNGDLTTGAVTITGAGNFIGAGNNLKIDSFTDGTVTGAGKISNAIIAAGANFAVTGSVDTIASNALFVITGDMSIANNKTLTADKSTLNVGGLLSTGNGNVTLMESAGTIGQLTTTGTLSLNHGSNITLSATDTTNKASSVATLNVGEAVVTGTAGSGSAANLDVKGKLSVTTGGAIYNGSTVTVNELDNATGIINVGSKDDTKGSSLIINKLTAASTGTFFVDPATENSIVQVKDTTTALTQDFIAGNNGIVSFGERGLEWTKAQIAESGMTKPSVLVLASPVTLNGGAQILVGDKYTSDKKWDVANNAGAAIDAYGLAIRGNSLVIADATNWAADVTGIKLAGAERNVLIEKTTGLRLYADNLKAGETRTLVSGIGQAEQVAGTALADKDNLAFEGGKSTNYMLVGVGDVVYNTGASNTGFITASTTLINATSVLPKLSQSMGTFLDGMATNPGFNSESENAGIRFVSRALDRRFLGVNDPQKAAATIEGAAQMAAVAGVQVSTIGAASVASGAVTTRTSFAQPLMDMTKAVAVHQDNDGALSLDTGLNAGNGMKNGLGVWIMPLYQSNKTWGQKAENFKSGMNSDLGGIALGADYTINDMFRFGAAFNVGAGYGQSTGDFNKTENRFNFWGVNLYGGWTMNNFGLSADVGYTSTFNAVKQDTPASLQMGNLKSDVTSSALQAGLKAEYKLETSVVDIIPHVGVRYMGLATDGYDVKSHGTVFSVERDFQSIWTFPIGVAFSKTITSDSGWMFKPMVDLSVVPAAGDIKAKSKTSIPGVGGQAEMKMQVVDTVTFDGGLGFEVGKDNLSFGLNYNVQASEHRTGHGVFGTLRYEF